MKNPKIYLILILLIAALLRFYQLGNVPPSPDWDEAALAYNAHSIFTTGRDEYGAFMPSVLRSFNDYKPALYTYIAIPFVEIFGLTTVAVRMPSAILGIIAVIATYFLVKELFAIRTKKEKHSSDFPEILALLAAFLLAISPWHIQFSRVAFESNVGVTFNILLVLFFIKGLRTHWMLLLAAFFAGINPSVYQSERVFTPLLVIALVIIFRIELFTVSKKYLFSAVVVGLLAILPLVLFIATDPNALERVKGTSVFNNQIQVLREASIRLQRDTENNDVFGQVLDNRRLVYAKHITAGYLSHFDLNWLFIHGDATTRHHTPGMGLLYITLLPFVFLGIYKLIFGPYDRKTKYLIFAWFLLAPVPASVTTGVPHAVRTMNFIPTYEIFIALGLLAFAAYLSQLKYRLLSIPVKYIIAVTCFLIFSFNFVYYLNQYFVQQNYAYAYDWQYGYAEAVPEVEKIKGDYKKVVVSDREPLGQSYIFFLFYSQYPPAEYQKVTTSSDKHDYKYFDKYEFRTFEWNKEFKNDAIVLVGGEKDFPPNVKVLKTIAFPNGKPAILIVDPKDNRNL